MTRKKLFSLFLCFAFLFSFSVSAFADMTLEEFPPSETPVEIPSVETSSETYIPAVETPADDTTLSDINSKLDTILETIPDKDTSSSVTLTETETEVNPSLSDDLTLVGVNSYSLNPITPSETTGLKSVILSLVGDYDAVVVEYQYQKDNGEFTYLRQIQPDYVFLCSAGIFVVIIYCTFRIGGALLRG